MNICNYNYTAQKFYQQYKLELGSTLSSQSKCIIAYQNLVRKKYLAKTIDKSLKNNLYNSLFTNLLKFITYKDNLNYINTFLSKIKFFNKKGIILPFINDYPLLKLHISINPNEYFLNQEILEKYHTRIVQIFSNSEFVKGDRKYRSFSKKGRQIISGDNTNDIWSLSGIAHELGHCLYENDIDRKSPLALFYSELIAHLFEEYFVKEYLIKYSKNTELQRWQQYQHSVDILNLYFFMWEWQIVLPSNLVIPKIFTTKALIFRESLFLLPGFQLVYAFASVWRFIFRKKKIINILYILERLKNETTSYKY